MLLSNMSKLDSVSRQILGLRVPVSSKSSAGEGDAAASAEGDDEIAALDLLLEVFLRGEGKKYNPNANYDFLASVFANVSLVRTSRSTSFQADLAADVFHACTAPSRPRLPPRNARPISRAAPRQDHLVH